MGHGDTLDFTEILFNTKFDYLFPMLAADPESLLPPGATTQGALLALGTAMAMDDLSPPGNSTIPAIFTYLGQFIDHNITARTDREIGVSRIATPDGNVMDLTPLASTAVVQKLVNGRRPQLDLSSVYGDGPSLENGPEFGRTEADILFDNNKRLLVTPVPAAPPGPAGFDVRRPVEPDGATVTLIADMRNNENLNVSQLHCAFLLFHNKVAAALPPALSDSERYIRARRLVRWAFQYIVVHDYLRAVCDPLVIEDILVNGNRYYAPNSDTAFMPLEFSVAAFRFGHSMIRQSYALNGAHGSASPLSLMDILNVGSLLEAATLPDGSNGKRLQSQYIIEWHNFAPISGHSNPQTSRTIDTLISLSLGKLPFFLPGSNIPLGALLQQLAQRNLLRGFLLSIPTGQAIAGAMDIEPLKRAQLLQDVDPKVAQALVGGGFDNATPLWYYVLQEAKVQHGGNRLGSVGSRIVGETLIGLVQKDRSSYLNHRQNPAVKANGIEVAAGQVIGTIGELLAFSGAPL